MSRRVHRILIDLDALLDTRLGTMNDLNPEYAFTALTALYMERLSDDPKGYCPDMDYEKFKDAYSKRNRGTLTHSYPTQLMYQLNRIIGEVEREIVTGSPLVNHLEIHINVYPYKFTKDEADYLYKSIRHYIHCKSPIEFFSYSLSQLTPEVINRMSYSNIYIYNFWDWYDEIFGKSSTPPASMSGTTFYTPALLKDLTTTVNTLNDLHREFNQMPDVFAQFNEWHREWFYVDATTSALFSISPHLLVKPK